MIRLNAQCKGWIMLMAFPLYTFYIGNYAIVDNPRGLKKPFRALWSPGLSIIFGGIELVITNLNVQSIAESTFRDSFMGGGNCSGMSKQLLLHAN
ncbi:hypothetical protein A0256_20750 [Mucilaginibacter sp. PAMC 26640]|nr:hypothetical protein A0256_20750 [Mucilaginibacter sp. PAMC 26640]